MYRQHPRTKEVLHVYVPGLDKPVIFDPEDLGCEIIWWKKQGNLLLVKKNNESGAWVAIFRNWNFFQLKVSVT